MESKESGSSRSTGRDVEEIFTNNYKGQDRRRRQSSWGDDYQDKSERRAPGQGRFHVDNDNPPRSGRKNGQGGW